MTTRTELIHRLEAVASKPAAVPSPVFVEELEARLLDETAVPLTLHAVDEVPTSAARRRLSVRAVGMAAAIAVVVGMILASLQDTPTRVATPVGPASPSTNDASGEDESSSLQDDGASDEVDAGDHGSRRTDANGSESEGGATENDEPSASTSAERTGDEDEAKSIGPPGWYAEPSEERFVLEAQPAPTGADLTWERFEGDDFFAYLVMRAQGEDPSYPRGEDDKTTFVHKSSDRDATTWSDTNPNVAGDTRYMVVVFDRTGRELARSNVAGVGASVGISIMLPTPEP